MQCYVWYISRKSPGGIPTAMLCYAVQARFHLARSIYLLPGLLGLEKPCFCSCLGRNSSSSVEAVMSAGLESSNYTRVAECAVSHLVRNTVVLIIRSGFGFLTFFAISIPISEVMAVRKLCFVEA